MNAPDLFTGIRAVAAGDAMVTPRVTRRLIDAFARHLPDPSTGRSPGDERLHQLTAREREVLVQVARVIRTPRSPNRGEG